MPAFQFDSSGIDPHYGGGSQLTVGKHPVVIVGSELKPTKNNDGGYMALTLEAIDGPAKGVQHIDRLNLHNKNPETVRIANQQLSAYCAVTGVFRFQATEELHGKPFVVEIGPDTRATTEGRTEVKKLFDINGNPPGQAGAGAAAGGGAGGGFGGASGGGAPANTGGGFAPGAGAPAGDAAPQGGNGGNWGGAGGGQAGGQQGGGAAPAGNGGGWSQGGGNGGGGGTPGWGNR